MPSDILISIQWWLSLFILGLGFYPLTALLFPRFLDKGYGFTKTVGMLVASYLMLIFGTLHLLSFSFISLNALLFVMGGILFILRRKKLLHLDSHLHLVKTMWKWIVIEEILFMLIFALWAYIRGFAPEINGLEKFMDYGFVNAILRSDYFPPKDMWLTPFSINYYYFGHFVTAVLTKLSLLSSNYTYNLMIATLAALTFVSSFSLAANLYQQVIAQKKLFKLLLAGILTAAIVTFAGNLHTLYTFFRPYTNEKPVPIWELPFTPQTFPNEYWYPNATRFIHNTIHEFPIYSWTVSDLHGHVTDIPFVLLTVAFIYSLFLLYHNKEKVHLMKRNKGLFSLIKRLLDELPLSLPHMLCLSLLLAVMYMTNAWDGLIYILLVILLIAYLEWQRIKTAKNNLIIKLAALILELVIPLITIGIAFFLFSLPFSIFFKPFVSGIGVLCAPEFLTHIGKIGPLLFEADHCQRSPWWQLLTLYGFFYFFVLVFLLSLMRIKKWATSDAFVVMLIILGTFLIIVPEFVYAKDIYPAHYRANTMFKLVFQSFILLSIVTGYSISRVSQILKERKKPLNLFSYGVFFILSLTLLTIVFIYPYYAVMSYYGNLKEYKGLDGTKYLQERYPDDARAIEALDKLISDQAVILEAQGDSYTDYARVSANTGLSTVLGWTVHEWLWRGTYDVPAPRIEEVKQMYESPDIEKTKQLLKKYNVEYIFLGQLEREKYIINEEKFEQIGKVTYRSNQTVIYKVF